MVMQWSIKTFPTQRIPALHAIQILDKTQWYARIVHTIYVLIVWRKKDEAKFLN